MPTTSETDSLDQEKAALPVRRRSWADCVKRFESQVDLSYDEFFASMGKTNLVRAHWAAQALNRIVWCHLFDNWQTWRRDAAQCTVGDPSLHVAQESLIGFGVAMAGFLDECELHNLAKTTGELAGSKPARRHR